LAYSVRQTSDAGYVIAGTADFSGAGGGDFWLVKTDSSGKQQWNKTYGGTDYDRAHSVQQTPDGGYIMAGTTDSFGAGGGDFWLVKTDSSGKQQWSKTCGGTADDWVYSAQQTSDGGYMIAGSTKSFGAGGADFWLVKTDSSGNQQWNKTYGGTIDEWAYSVRQTSEGGYIIAGIAHYDAGSGDFWLVKTDPSGNQQWGKTYGGSGYESAESVQETSDGGYVIAGATNSFGAGQNEFWLVKTGDATPPSTISDLSAGSPTSDSIVLTWTAPGDNWMRGNATGYMVKYSTSGPITDANWNSATTYPQSWTPARNCTMETHMVSGLTSATEYWFAVQAHDDLNLYGGVSNSPSATTATTTPLTIIMGGVGVAIAAIVIVAVMLMKRRNPR